MSFDLERVIRWIGLPWHLVLFLWALAMRVSQDRVGLVAAGVAFYGMLALFPAITALVAVGGIVITPDQILAQIDSFHGVVPEEVLGIVETQTLAVVQADPARLELAALTALGVAFWSASRGVSNLVEGLNHIYKSPKSGGFIWHNLRILLLTILLIGGVIVALAVIVALPVALSYVDLGRQTLILSHVARWLVLGMLTVWGLGMLYRQCPDPGQGAFWRWVSPGALIACIGWVGASAGFTWYVSAFAIYNKSFGALAGGIVLMMWLWISAWLVLLGAAINAEMAAHLTERRARKDEEQARIAAVLALVEPKEETPA